MNKLHIILLFSIIKPSETPPAPKGKESPKYMFSMCVPFVARVGGGGVSAWPTDEDATCRSSASLKGSLIWQVPRDHEGAPFVSEEAPHVVDAFLGKSIGEVETLIDRKELAVNQKFGFMGNTLLMYAVLKDRKDLCQLLLDKNADLAIRNNHNLNALQWAKINGSHKDIIKLLTEKGAN